jgi:hypothetical protein
MSSPDFAKAASQITADKVRDLLLDLVDIASPTGREIGVAHYLAKRMRRIGMAIDLPLVDEGRPYVVGLLRGRGDGLNLLFTGHMDTSYSGEEPFLVGPGRGCQDAAADHRFLNCHLDEAINQPALQRPHGGAWHDHSHRQYAGDFTAFMRAQTARQAELAKLSSHTALQPQR